MTSSHELLYHYPDQIDGIDRLAEVYEARDNNKKAAEYYHKAVAFAQKNPGFDQDGIDWYLSKAKCMESENNRELNELEGLITKEIGN